MMDLDPFLFNPFNPKISHSSVVKDQVASMYIQSSIPVIMARKDQKHCIKQVFLSRSFENNLKAVKSLRHLLHHLKKS